MNAPGVMEAGACTHDKDLSADLSVISGSVRIQKSLVGRASLSSHVIGLRITGRVWLSDIQQVDKNLVLTSNATWYWYGFRTL